MDLPDIIAAQLNSNLIGISRDRCQILLSGLSPDANIDFADFPQLAQWCETDKTAVSAILLKCRIDFRSSVVGCFSVAVGGRAGSPHSPWCTAGARCCGCPGTQDCTAVRIWLPMCQQLIGSGIDQKWPSRMAQ
jgi:hypothetical protein